MRFGEHTTLSKDNSGFMLQFRQDIKAPSAEKLEVE